MKTVEFKPYDKVIVRSEFTNNIWTADLYSHYDVIDGCHVLIGYGSVRDEMGEEMLPYENNEDLIGKVNAQQDPDTPKPGDLVFVFESVSDMSTLNLTKFDEVSNGFFVKIKEGKLPVVLGRYCIKYDDYDPDTTESDLKNKIWVVRNDNLIVKFDSLK